jgi:SAM-dependent methyltransferase
MAWWEEAFGPDYLEMYIDLLPEERSRAEADFLYEQMNLEPGMELLDLCCGQGRISVPLVEKGLKVTGYDYSEYLMGEARKLADKQKVELDLVQGDMRGLDYEEKFDAVINMFTAFGYFQDESENDLVLQNVARALKPGGHFIIEVINGLSMLIEFQPKNYDDFPERKILLLEEREFNYATWRVKAKQSIIKDGVRHDYEHHLRIYTAGEMHDKLIRAGLEPVAVFGDALGEEFDSTSSRIVWHARKN